jgi:drug/metabolite transporter (DMT)-like permease
MADPESTEDQRKDIPTSLTIVNEATPLLSNSANATTGSSSGSNRRSSTISLSTDHARRKKELFGLLLMTLSALGFSVMSLCVKLGGVVFPSFELVFARSLVQLVLGLGGCAILKVNPLGDKKVRGWLIVRGLAGSIGLSLFFYSLTVLPLADATGEQITVSAIFRKKYIIVLIGNYTVVFFLGPIFTALLASFALGEPFSLFDGICAVLCFVGVVLVSRPEFLFGKAVVHAQEMDAEFERIFAVMCSVVGAMMSAVAYVTVRKIGKGAHFMVHVVYFGAISSALSPIGIWGLQHFVMPETWNDYLILILVGTFAFVGQCLLNQG